MSKDELFNLPLDYQNKSNSTLGNVDNDTGELRIDFDKLKADVAISRTVNTKLTDRLVHLERQY